jgi:hypothetical protein
MTPNKIIDDEDDFGFLPYWSGRIWSLELEKPQKKLEDYASDVTAKEYQEKLKQLEKMVLTFLRKTPWHCRQRIHILA